jgi:DNA helicase HerA-like ATPase
VFGKILTINNAYALVENLNKKVESNLLGLHIVFETQNQKIVGEIIEINEDKIKINFVGEFVDGRFKSGLTNKPTSNSTLRIIYTNEIPLLLGVQEIESKEYLYLGKSLKYPQYNVSININEFFSQHFAIIGNTGSGKSSSIARIIQNLFYRNINVPKNSSMVLFDVYGEYNTALKEMESRPLFKVNNLTTKVKFAEAEIVSIPAYFLEVDDLALLLGADDRSQLAIIEKALKLVYLFTDKEENVKDHKNNIIAKALLDILSSGKNPTQIRDQIIAVLSAFYTKDINLNSQIIQPGYIRTLKQCLSIDATGKINTMQLVVEFLEQFNVHVDYINNENQFFTLKDLYNAFEFALISEGILKSDKVYDKNNVLKVRLDSIINSESSKYFEYNKYITKEEFVKKLFSSKTGEKAQILNINLNYIDERFAKVLTKIYSKIFFDYAISLENRGKKPIQIILEEAHRYVQNDNDINIIGYNIFDRITKEGRKYGVTLGLITQRPSELSSTALSQCSNFLIFRLFHPKDTTVVGEISYNLNPDDLASLKTLRPGVALVIGNAIQLPQFVKIDMPNPAPSSANSDIKNIWFN